MDNPLDSPSPYNSYRPSSLIQAFVALLLGFLFFLVLAGLANLVFDSQYRDRIYPGVTMAGADLGGLTTSQAAERLAEQINYPSIGKVVLKDGSKMWITRPADLGFTVDTEVCAQAAYLVGRQHGSLTRLADKLSAWSSGVNLPPLINYDGRLARQYLERIAAEVDRPTIEASLAVTDLEVVVKPGQIGRKVDIQASLEPLEAQLRSLTDGIVPLVIREDAPAILDANEQAQVARAILSAPLALQLPASDAQAGALGPWKIEPSTLAGWLVIEKVIAAESAQYQIGLDQIKLREYLSKIAPTLELQASDARFTFDDETRQLKLLQPSITGRTLNIDASLQAIEAQLLKGQHAIPLELNYIQPRASGDATAEQLGIKELVSSYTSYFRGSSRERVQNIKTAASRFHGLLVPPNSVFSMANAMGDVSLDNGYSEALIIVGGRTIKGVGGGVCQVSTTLFRTAFFGGYPIVERYPHAYRVGYYEQTRTGWNANLAGLDATVFVPEVDFKFENDRSAWLLMETYVDAKAGALTWKFYSTSDGREVDWNTTGPQNVVKPPAPLYQENPDLVKGEIKQVDWAADGADVTATRVVTRDGQELFSDTVITHYLPWRDVYQYGPGTKIPDKDKDQ